ncbi:hypothetical protein PsYK624_039980 [Phanerochaete sordida]|uniref:Uncharacterized protein n=1 Tax=Phanerochaete sordida TaxID=48140 RepID=A0A9P3G5G6_9APHY|nr:hypothetical protein PsYK624_039980 [Phanerochaete sordida]
MLGLARASHALRAASLRSFRPSKASPLGRSLVPQHRRNSTEAPPSPPSLFDSRADHVRVVPYGGGDIVAGIIAHQVGLNQFMFRHASQRTRLLALPAEDWTVTVPSALRKILTYKVDPAQDLLVVVTEPERHEPVCVVNLLSMSSGAPHPSAVVPTLTIPSEDPWPDDISISGSSLAIRADGTELQSTVAAWNWKQGVELYSATHIHCLALTLLDEGHLLLAHLIEPFDEGRFSAMTVLPLSADASVARAWQFQLPALRGPGMRNLTLASQPTISAPDADRVLLLQMNFFVGEDFKHHPAPIVTLTSALHAHIAAHPAGGVFAWAAWAPAAARIFVPEFCHDDEAGQPYVYGTRIIRYRPLAREMQAAMRGRSRVPPHLRRETCAGAVEILDFGAGALADAARAGAPERAPWAQAADPEWAYCPDPAEGDSAVRAALPLPPFVGHDYFGAGDGAVATGLAYRSRVRALGLDRHCADVARAADVDYRVHRPLLGKLLYRRAREEAARAEMEGVPPPADGDDDADPFATARVIELGAQDMLDGKRERGMGRLWRAFDKAFVTEESLLFVRHSWFTHSKFSDRDRQECLILDLTDKDVF